MATLSTQTFVQLVRNTATAIQARSTALADLSVGSILRSVIEANSAVVMWLQSLITQVLATTRAATSSGADLDSWVGDYGLTRAPGAAATGMVTFARFSAVGQAVVPVGATCQSTDGTQNYTVTLDASNPAYSAGVSGYVMAATVSSVNVPVQAQVIGAAANAVAGGISVITSAIPGVDTVTNSAALTNGADPETDAALRTRFVAYIASLSKATKAAIGYAITSVPQVASYSLVENQTYAGSTQMGYFYAVVDDGTGTPSGTFISTVSNAIDAVRPFTSTFGVFAPVVVTANVAMTITTAVGYDHAATASVVASAIRTYLSGLVLGQSLAFSRLAQVAYDASPGVTNVTGVTLNGGTADLSATAKQVIKPGTVAVA